MGWGAWNLDFSWMGGKVLLFLLLALPLPLWILLFLEWLDHKTSKSQAKSECKQKQSEWAQHFRHLQQK